LVPHGSRALPKPKSYVRVKQDKFSMVIGKDIKVKDILKLLETTLVGRFYGKKMQKASLMPWVLDNWMSAMSYMSVFHGFVHSWIFFQFWLRGDYIKIKEVEWDYGPLGLVPKTSLEYYYLTRKHLSVQQQPFPYILDRGGPSHYWQEFW